MGWLLGCFKCRRRRPTRNAICKDKCTVSSTVALLSAKSAQAKESSEVQRVLSVEGDESKRNSSAHIKSDKRTRSTRRPSSEQLLQVEKLEEEIDSLNKQLMEEATQATSLTNEVRHLRKCSALLDSPNAFKKALSALEQALEKGHLEESQPLLYLHSLLSKIQCSEEVIETSPEHRDEERQAKGFSECLDVSSLVTKNNRKSLETSDDKALQAEPDHSQGNIFAPATILREPDERQRLMLKDEQSTCNSRPQYSCDFGDIHSIKTQQISVVKRKSSTTLSFSGFLLLEDVTEEGPISDKAAAVEPFSCTEFAVTKIIEKTDLRDENLVEASKSLFAFSTESTQGHSTLTGQSLLENISKDFSISNSDSDACSEKPEGNGGFFNLHYRSPRCMWSPQDDNTHELDRVCSSLSTEQCQIDAYEHSHSGFSEADELSLLSTCCNNSMDRISSSSLDSEESDPHYGTKASDSKVLPKRHIPSVKDKIPAKKVNSSSGSSTDIQAGIVTRSMDKSVYLNQRCAASVDPVLKGRISQAAGSEVNHCFNHSMSEGHMTSKSLEKANQGKAVFFENPMHSSFNEAPSKVLDKITSNEDDSLYRTSHATSPCLSQEFCLLGGEDIVELSSPGTTCNWSPDTQTSPYAVHTFSPQPVDSIIGGPSGCLSETPSTPASVTSHESRLHLVKADASKLNFTPLRTPLASHRQGETLSTRHSQGSPSSLGEDRPILGTVAAHWNPSSASSTQKWWDGKGIPNSTNKYKEDQKVSWHATPFEVRLERALAKQGRVFQKKLFTGAMAAEMEVSI